MKLTEWRNIGGSSLEPVYGLSVLGYRRNMADPLKDDPSPL